MEGEIERFVDLGSAKWQSATGNLGYVLVKYEPSLSSDS
jgi:hypothetical protein